EIKMKKIKLIDLVLIGSFVLSLYSLTWGGLVLQPQSKLWLEGDSTLHKYSSSAAQIQFTADSPSAAETGASLKVDEVVNRGLVKNLRVVVPVDQLRSGEKGLDKNMVKALKGADYPNIVFKMDSYKIIVDTVPAKISATGTLSIAGVEKSITLNADVKSQDDRIIIDGKQPLLMTDFGIKPPTLMLGAIKVDNHITVKFHLELEQAVDQQKVTTK